MYIGEPGRYLSNAISFNAVPARGSRGRASTPSSARPFIVPKGSPNGV
jgi:hypothetical protein